MFFIHCKAEIVWSQMFAEKITSLDVLHNFYRKINTVWLHKEIKKADVCVGDFQQLSE